MKVITPSCIAMCFLAIACDSVTDYERQIQDIAKREKVIDCELNDLRDSVGNEWERVTSMMRDKLPVSMPMEEKNNMLQAKNANLIRMFESYETLDDDVKMAVDNAERKDGSIAAQVMQFRRGKQEIEQERMEVFGLASQVADGGTDRLRQIYDEILNGACQ